MKVFKNKCLYLLVLLLVISCAKDEEDLTGSIYGKVTDTQSGEVLHGATVTLTPGGISRTTGDDGTYEFLNLEPGQYQVEASLCNDGNLPIHSRNHLYCFPRMRMDFLLNNVLQPEPLNLQLCQKTHWQKAFASPVYPPDLYVQTETAQMYYFGQIYTNQPYFYQCLKYPNVHTSD